MRRTRFGSAQRALIAWLSLELTGGFAIAIPSAKAQEPLLLRIRPAGDIPSDLGNVGDLGNAGDSDDRIAREARARSQAVWDRADRRARIAIASVCTGCIASARAPATSSVRIETATPAADSDPPLHFAQTGAP